MLSNLKKIVILTISLLSFSCSLSKTDMADNNHYKNNGLSLGKSNYFASRSWAYVDMPGLSSDIDYPYSYYVDSDFYGFYELSPFDIMMFFKSNNVISRKMRFSVIKVGDIVGYGDLTVACSILITSPVSSGKTNSSKDDLAVYIMTIADGQIVGAENIAKPNGVALTDSLHVCKESFY